MYEEVRKYEQAFGGKSDEPSERSPKTQKKQDLTKSEGKEDEKASSSDAKDIKSKYTKEEKVESK